MSAAPREPATRLALIAGAGRFPFFVAQEARRQGRHVVGFGLKGWVDPDLASHVDAYEELAVGELSTLIERLKTHRVSQAVMAGKVTKRVLMDPRSLFDREALALLKRVKEFSVGGLLGAIADRLAGEGVVLLDSSTFLHGDLCPEGVLTARKPTAEEQADIDVGVAAARAIASLDIGQTVVVKQRVVVAVEALEGTDATIERAHALAGERLTVVKTAAPNQDRRFDLPIIGVATVQTLHANGVSCLAVEAGTTLLLERDRVLAAANDAGLCVIGRAALPPTAAGRRS